MHQPIRREQAGIGGDHPDEIGGGGKMPSIADLSPEVETAHESESVREGQPGRMELTGEREWRLRI
jgi:hypothetical protein